MFFKGHRDFLSASEKEGEIVRIEKEVDWNLEAGAVTRRSYELKERAPFFQKIKDYPEGYRMSGAPLSNYRRVAVAMGMDADAHPKEIFEEYGRRIKSPVKPVLVQSGSCKENIITGDEINLFKFPAPMVHDGDGGRYLATWHLIVTRDAEDTNWVNWGMYRQMVHNRKIMGGLILPGQDIGRMYQKYEKLNKPMPYATVIGPDPLSAIVGTASTGPGESEVDLAGGLKKGPVELVKCETVDLEVPADAEIIVEGYVLPHKRLEEGPFGEYTGYRSSPRMPRPIYTVTAITHRNDPIVPIANMGIPIDDCDILLSVSWSCDIREALKKFPIVDINVPPEAVGHLAVISVDKFYEGIANHVADALWGSKLGYLLPFIVVVDSDVDVFNIDEVVHAIVTKCHPVRGIHSRANSPGHGLMPFLSSYERMHGICAHALFDCTWPIDWDKNIDVPQRASFTGIYPENIQDMVLKNWKEYGY